MTKKKEEQHSKHYWEEGRNGYHHTTTLDSFESEKSDDKKDLKVYTEKLEDYIKDMEGYLLENIPNNKEDYSFSLMLDSVTKKVTDLLKEKNKAYGNTALNPPNIFSKLSSTEAICARLDDKLSRIQNRGINDATEDTVDDVIGYLLLLKMSMAND
tara:strand:+ start:366 stop:833 length:468 start_codon:yes stop_codon:yes gene_type:complete